MKLNFKTPFNFKDHYVTCSGTHTIDLQKQKATGEKVVETHYEYIYKQVHDDKGNRHLVIAGRVNTYDKIQSFKNDVDIYKILERYLGGDISVLDKNKGFYVDCTKIPKDYNEYHNRILEGQAIFDSLPIDFKEEFGKNVNTFMNSIFDKSFDERYKNYVSRKNSYKLSNVNSSVTNLSSDKQVVEGGNDNV